jgi:hypothetical protein
MLAKLKFYLPVILPIILGCGATELTKAVITSTITSTITICPKTVKYEDSTK